MLNPRLASRYAKSLIDLAIENKNLDSIYKDILGIQHIFYQSKEFALLMKSPIIKADTKQNIVGELTKGNINPLTYGFIQLIINKGREFFLQEIVNDFVNQYKKYNKINEVKLTTATALDNDMKTIITDKIASQFKDLKIELTTNVDESILGGFIVETNSNVFDASIIRDLKDIKKQFLKNEYIPNIR